MDTTHLQLPYLAAAQAQKHVTHNEALRLLDAMVQLAVLDRDLHRAAGQPADGDRYIVASGATGAWAGWDGNIAYWVDGAWIRLVPRPGWRAWVDDEDVLLVFDGSAWTRRCRRCCRTCRCSASAPPPTPATRSRRSSTPHSGPRRPWPRAAPAISSTP